MKKNKVKFAVIDIVLFNFKIKVTNDLLLANRENLLYEIKPCVACCAKIKDTQAILIYLDSNMDIDFIFGYVAHEASHAVTFILEYIDSDCDELRSYLLHYIVNEIKKATRWF